MSEPAVVLTASRIVAERLR